MSFIRILTRLLLTLYLLTNISSSTPIDEVVSNTNNDDNTVTLATELNHTLSLLPNKSQCFPSIGFEMPQDEVPKTLTDWWCDWNSEYGFVGFSYEVSECQSSQQLHRDFKDIKQTFQGRYVRIYGVCDRPAFYDDVIDAAWQAGIGVHALIWFGFDGDNKWKKRRDDLISTLYGNKFAKFVIRVVQFGSEPLFDDVLNPEELAQQVLNLKDKLKDLKIPVTVSDLAYGFQKHGGAASVISAIDIIDAHMLPFFAQDASTAKKSWPLVTRDINWFTQHGQGKKIYLSENGWPSETYPGVEPNSDKAVADVQNEHDYYNLLDEHCQYFKTASIGWFAHIYSDSQEPGYGIYDTKGKLKFPFKPRITC